MKVCLRGLSKFGYSRELIEDFLYLLQEELPLKHDCTIEFVSQKKGVMTTGVRNPDEMLVLAQNRLLIDVLRTIAHEWVHEYQHQKMGLKDTDVIQDIGGPEENMASALASVFIKKFERDYPQYKENIYGVNN